MNQRDRWISSVRKNRLSRRRLLGGALAGSAALGIAGVVGACGDDDDDGQAEPVDTEEEGGQQGEVDPDGEITVAAAATLAGLDFETLAEFTSMEFQQSLYERLVAYETTEVDGVLVEDFTRLQGSLAESWENSDDGLSWTFKMRPGLISAQGNELTAEDVKFTWDHKFDVGGRSTFLFPFAGLKDKTSIEVVDPSTVRFVTEAPNPTFLVNMEVIANQIFDSKAAQDGVTSDDPLGLDYLATNHAGWSPFNIESWEPGSQAVLARNDEYPLRPAKLARITNREVPTSSNRLALLQEGTVDIAENLTPRELKQLEGNSDISTYDYEGMTMVHLTMNTTLDNFSDPRVRQAIAHATPYDAIIDAVYQGTAQRLRSFTPPSIPFATDQYWVYEEDLEEAMRLLEAAGKGEGFTATFSFNSGFPDHEQVAIQLQTGLARIGIELELNKLPPAAYTERRQAKDFEMEMFEDNSFIPDTGLNWQLFWGSQAFTNESGFADDEVDQLIVDGLSTLDPDEREGIYDRIAEIVNAAVPHIPLVLPGYHIAHRNRVGGITYKPTARLEYRDLFVSS